MQEAISYKPWPPIHAGGSLKAGPPLLGDRANQAATTTDGGGGVLNQHGGGGGGGAGAGAAMRRRPGGVREVVSENALIVVGRRGCCMGHVVKRLLLGLGVNPAVYEVDEEDEKGVADELERIGGGGGGEVQFPAVFIGGRLFGGLDRVMATHISGELVPILRQAGALWL
ncbi:glutaredoxin-C9-like [Syzygium oleosum]|uniref:glutaredoxin-C9-like n=1 Tax=Syzygium oleosum TaxID=219896 RepID=UPI0011D1F762|nr:glutaredoxin-C9-like [Syzygium oleosum]